MSSQIDPGEPAGEDPRPAGAGVVGNVPPATPGGDVPLLEVEDLAVTFQTEDGPVKAVSGITYALRPGRTLGIVGESGSGKSVSSMTVMGLTRLTGATISGSVRYRGRELLTASDEVLRELRGNEIAMIFQDPLSSLHPFFRIGAQITEAITAHHQVSQKQARARAIEMLGFVGIPEPQRRIDAYPHEFSGGMRQRVMIAMALVNDPKVLFADEPTSALDVTVQAQILKLVRRLQDELDTAVVMITHDLGVAAETSDDVVVMRRGLIVEQATVQEVFSRPREAYTRALLEAIPTPPPVLDAPVVEAAAAPASDRTEDAAETAAAAGVDVAIHDPEFGGADAPAVIRESARTAAGEAPLMRVRGLGKEFPITRGILIQRKVGAVHAVTDVDLDVHHGETLGIVGESGSGKSTTARMMTRLLDPTAGTIEFDGRDISALSRKAMRPVRRDMQMIFQDPFSSLNPRKTVGSIIAEPFALHGMKTGDGERRDAVQALLAQVGLDPEHYNRLPHQFSGGQRQRIGIARAIALQPKLIVADEPVSALDVSIQAQVLRLLSELRDSMGLTLVFISHDLSVVQQVCDRVAVMHQGRLVEVADSDELYRSPQHPYTRGLLSSVPRADPSRAGHGRRVAAGPGPGTA